MASKNCGECRFYQVTQAREFDQIGTCKLQKLMGFFARPRLPATPFPYQEITGYPRRAAGGQAGVRVAERRRPCTSTWPRALWLN